MTRRDASHIGRYEIQRRLGVGGMGALYLARDPSLDRLVAIKLLKEDFQDDPELRERFIREARSVARLRHPNIVVVHDVGEDDGRPFMAMEYIAGETLTDVLRRMPPLPMGTRLSMIEDLCAGLAHAHTAGIIHRDIKPANIMLDGEGVLKILDFGIARIADSGMTQEGMMMGTLNYMSPEQVAGRGVDHRTDIFATGAVLYEAIAFAQAFPGPIDAGILRRILSEGPVPLEQRVPGLDPELAGIVRKALDPEPARRYQDASVMRQDLSRVRRKLGESEGSPRVRAERVTKLFDPSEASQAETGPTVESDRPRGLSPERLAELRRQQVEEHLRSGDEAFARGDHAAALQYAERAATVDHNSRAAIALIDKARLAIEGKVIRQLLGEAQRLLADGHLEDAAALAEKASATLPDIQGAADLRREVRQTVEKIAALRQREQRIASSLARAQSSLEQGAYDTALRAVYEALALDPDSAQARALEQQAKSLLLTQREHAQARRGAYDKLARAQLLAKEGRFDEAIAEISAVSGPSDTVRVAAEEALTAVRQAQRLAAQAAVLANAQAAFDRRQLEQAQSLVNSIPVEERNASARELRIKIEKALQAQRQLQQKQQTLEAALRTVRELVDQHNLAKALEHLEETAAIGLEDARIPALRQQIADLVIAADHKRREEARERVAAKRVEAARRLLANGDGYTAIAFLERDGSGHPLVEQALHDIRTAVAEQEERVREEAERRRQEEEARRRAEAEALKKLEEQRKAEEQRQAEERRRQVEEARRQREAQRQRVREELATLVAGAERALADHRPDEATALLKQADERVASAEDTDLQRRVDRAKAEADRQIRQQQEEIRRREEDARQREEEARQREAEARQREEEARRREQALKEILAKVQATPDHEAALGLLNEALTLAPADERVQTLLHERREAQRVEEQRQEQEARRREEERRAQEELARHQAEEEAERLREEQRREAEEQRLEQEERQRREEAAALVTSVEQALIAKRPDEAVDWLRRAQTARLVEEDEELARRLDAARTELTRQREEAAARERERLEQQARDARAVRVVERARQLFASGQHEEAVTLLRGAPAHPATQLAIEELETQWARIARQRQREMRRRARQQQLASSVLALRSALRDGRVQLLIAAVLSVTVGWAVWQYRPLPTPAVEVTPSPAPPSASPKPSPSAGPERPAAVTPEVERPAGPGAQPDQGGRGPVPGGGNPPVTGRGIGNPSPAPAVVAPGVTETVRGRRPDVDNVPTAKEPLAPEPGGGPPRPEPPPSRPAEVLVPAAPPTTTTTPDPQRPAVVPQPDLAAEETAIRQYLNRYVDAYRAMDVARLREIDPNFKTDLNRIVLKSVELRLSDVVIKIAPDGAAAVLTATQNFRYEWNRPGPPTSSGPLLWNLRKIGGTWTVVR